MLKEPAGVFLDDFLWPVELKDLLELSGELRWPSVAGLGGVCSLCRFVRHPGEIEAWPRFHLSAGFQHPAHDRCCPALGPRDLDARHEVCRQGRFICCVVFLHLRVLIPLALGLGGLDLISEPRKSRDGPHKAAFRYLSSMATISLDAGGTMPREHCGLGQVLSGRRFRSQRLGTGNGLSHGIFPLVAITILLIRALVLEATSKVGLAARRGDQTKNALVHIHKHAAAVALWTQHLLFCGGLVIVVF